MFNISKIIPRVMSTAKLAEVNGSAIERMALADNLEYKFTEFVKDVFERKGKVSKRELKTWTKTNCPGVNIKFARNKDTSCYGRLSMNVDKETRAIDGYTILLPFNKNIFNPSIEKEGINTAFHEMEHLFVNVTQPKFISRINSNFSIGKIEGFGIESKKYHTNFYNKYIYSETGSATGTKALFTKTLSSDLKALMKEHLEYSSQAEKIETLQEWRHGFKTEKEAFKAEITNTNKVLNKEHLTQSQIEKKWNMYEFDKKIKIIEGLLFEELQKQEPHLHKSINFQEFSSYIF